MIDIIARGMAATAAKKAEEMGSGSPPYISDNGTWMVWNAETQQYEDSGVPVNGAKSFTYTQGDPSKEWIIEHNLNKYPSVTVVNDNLNVIVADIQYMDLNRVKLTFATEYDGKAFLN